MTGPVNLQCSVCLTVDDMPEIGEDGGETEYQCKNCHASTWDRRRD